jgi:Uma2 family endonuclease
MVVAQASRELLLRSVDATWTAEDWELLSHEAGRRYEIIDGVLYVSTAPSARHQRILRRSFIELHEQIDERGIGMTLWSPIGVFMPGSDPVQPDLLVIRADNLGIIGERRVDGVPALIVEVLSPSNPEHDLVTKRAAYARAGVPEYWVFRPEERDVLVHSDPEPTTGQYLQVRHIPSGGELVSPTLPFRASVASFFADEADRAE